MAVSSVSSTLLPNGSPIQGNAHFERPSQLRATPRILFKPMRAFLGISKGGGRVVNGKSGREVGTVLYSGIS